MHAVMRDYSGDGAKKLFDILEKRTAEVKEVIMPIKGFVSYSLVRTARGGFSITIYTRSRIASGRGQAHCANAMKLVSLSDADEEEPLPAH